MRVISILSILLLLLYSCSGSKNTDQAESVTINPEFSRYISAFTGGVINLDAPIRVQFLEDLNPEKMAEIDLVDIFEIYPEVDGIVSLKDKRTLEFVPTDLLTAGTRYKVTVKLDEFIAVENGLDEFVFNFSTVKKSFNLSIIQFESSDENDFKRQNLHGQLTFSAPVDSNGVAKILTAVHDGEELEITLQKESKFKYNFTVKNILRKNERTDLHLKWNGESIGVKKKSSKTIKIPNNKEFVVMDVEVKHSPTQYVIVHFSDPLDADQFLDGLAYLQDHDVKVVAESQRILLYPTSRIVGKDRLIIEKGIRNKKGKKLEILSKTNVFFEDIKPEIKLYGEGNIVPKESKVHFPFEAINLKAVDVSVTKIFEDNVIQFLQVNSYDGTYQLRRVAQEVFNERVDLDPDDLIDLHKWNNFSIDLSKYIELDLGAIYRVELSAKKEYSLYECVDENEKGEENLTSFQFTHDDREWNEDNWYSSDYYYDYDYYDYDYSYNSGDYQNPCSDYYYRSKKIERNILVSDIGIIAKAGADKKMHVFLTDLNTVAPMAGASVKFYDFQQQLLGEVVTDKDGMAVADLTNKPFVLVASLNDQKGYLKLNDGESLSLSKFDVSGASVQHGVKGFIYTERGVWRPGDSLYVSFIIEDNADVIPANHPVKFELINPKGIVVEKRVVTYGLNGLYDFRTATNENDITGNYRAKISVGNRKFYKTLKVEAVKPNRLKINLGFAGDLLGQTDNRHVEMEVNWLHGAVANALKTKVDVHLTSTTTKFKRFKSFIFDNPIESFTSDDKTIFEGKLNQEGKVKFDHGIYLNKNAPGMLKAYFTTKVFENGGEFSIDRSIVTFSPFKNYVGINVPEGDLYGGGLVTDQRHEIDFVTVDENGNLKDSELDIKVYKLSWRWWWDSYDNNLSSYIARSSTTPVQTKTIRTKNGKGTYNFQINQPEYGRYLILAKDRNSGHTTGKVVYMDWPYTARANRRNAENATMLTFSTDKETYVKGETVNMSIPSPAAGRVLICLESGTKIIDKFWIDTEKGETKFSFEATDQMDPNVFIHATLIQPHENQVNDLPIRLYGVIPLGVEDPATHLQPTITMKDVLRPESTAQIKVGEKSNKHMTYTLAIVDEGLLDLTNFKTPNPWKHFYAREALGVKTWDMYDYVMGAYADKMDQLLAIGGDADGFGKKAVKANRFKPMVKFIGPYESKGKAMSHKIDIPNYVGAVRVMVIAEQDGAYGSAEKSVAVRNPLMVLGTLPRVVGPTEKVTLPVNVFAMEKEVKNVKVVVETNDFFNIDGGKVKSVKFSKIGDKLVNFDLTVAKKTGIGKVTIYATSGEHKARYDFEIDVRSPNPIQTTTVEKILQAGESFNQDVAYFGLAGTNQAYLEISNFPPLDLGRRLDYLIDYPHGCIEQTTSAVFPQLFLADLMELDKKRKAEIQANVNAAIQRFQLFQTVNGGFSYWPGGSYDSDWGTNYAGHFIIEAEKKGYAVPSNLKSNWIKFQRAQARNWNRANESLDGANYNDLTQAYRLYTLALAGKAETGMMNRLRERDDLSLPARWRLAAAYRLTGQKEAAMSLISNQETTVPTYREMSYTYGSNTRDEAMILETLVLMDKKGVAADLAKRIANQLNQQRWMSTQTTAYSLLAVSKFIGANKVERNLKFDYKINGQAGNRNSKITMVSFDLAGNSKNVSVKNSGEGILYLRLITKGVPVEGEEEAVANNVNISVNYFTMKNVPINVSEMQQGQDFIAEITVRNQGLKGDLKEMILAHIAPSGWEIHNTRMDDYQHANSSVYTYQDQRDDRLYTYFDIRRNQSKTFRVQFNSSYLGKFYLPGIVVEAMYDNTVYARTKGQWVDVVQNGSMQ